MLLVLSLAKHWLLMVDNPLRAEKTLINNEVSRQIAGVFLIIMLLISITQLFASQIPYWLAGAFSWLAMLFLLPQLISLQCIQSIILLNVGVSCLGIAWLRGVDIDVLALVSQNQNLLSLLAGVSFLKLITTPSENNRESLPTGKKAFLKTVLGTHLFSSVINLSALFIVTDRLQHNGRLEKSTAIPLMRAFSAAAFWSPFFAAMGVALTYAPDASLTTLVIQGIPFVVFGLFYTTLEAYKNDSNHLTDFQGYPMSFSALWVPVILAIFVIIAHQLFENIAVVLIVASLSLLLTVLVSFLRMPLRAVSMLRNHTISELPNMAGELALFLSAGVLAVGFNALLQSSSELMTGVEFSYSIAITLLSAIVFFALLGVHPVISISCIGVWVVPLNPQPNILGSVFLCGWAIGVVAAPLSGLNLALNGRYGISAKNIFSWHIRYALTMLIFSCAMIWLYMKLGSV
jgi:hypothetical protein